ncbi:MAG TPA: hypothetical protein GX744_00295 [Firmicutes bacterium]|jgi:omega-amidase|nr:hypothetical protein [Bacillota bacterium]
MIRAAVFSLGGIRTGKIEDYADDLSAYFRELQPDLAVLPAYSSLLLCAASGRLQGEDSFNGYCKAFVREAKGWNEIYLELHSELARDNKLFLVAGTTLEEEGGKVYHSAYCFGPDGEICARQRQTHLSREERAFGLSRGGELSLFEVAGMKAGFLVGNDARHPETGRILALKGAALVIHSGAIESGAKRVQPAGIWAQVQQNQFWAAEAQLKGALGGRSFGASSAVIGPCEITPDLSGYLARESEGRPFAAAELDEDGRLRIKKSYPLLKLLHPAAYRGRLPELYG